MEKKARENVKFILVQKSLLPRLCCHVFHFHQIWYNATNTFGKNKSQFGIASQLKVTNWSRIMLVCRWVSANDLVQNKFRSIMHLLSQNLLAQSHRQKHQMNVQDPLKVNNNETRTKSMTSFWCAYA